MTDLASQILDPRAIDVGEQPCAERQGSEDGVGGRLVVARCVGNVVEE